VFPLLLPGLFVAVAQRGIEFYFLTAQSGAVVLFEYGIASKSQGHNQGIIDSSRQERVN
jgi:hypothetical protein